LISGINVEAFEKKLYEHETGSERDNIKNMTIKPLTELHYTDPDLEREVEFKNILIFSISGLLVILCALFNYLTLFLSRFRIRQKEMALRVVCGASEDSLLAMLSVEFILTLLFAVLLGCTLTQWLHKPFLTLSNIQANLPAIYRETLMYIGSVILISLLAFWLILFIFRRRSLNQSIRQSNKALLRKGSIVVQLIISIGFSFCTIIILKQIYFLHHSADLGFSFQNRATIQLRGSGDSEAFGNQLKQIPEITEIVEAKGMVNIVSQSVRSTVTVRTWDDEPANAEAFPLLTMYVSPEYNAFYDFRLVAGEMLTDTDPQSMVLINESAVKVFGWHDPVGKRFLNYYMVKGIIKDVYNFAPTIPAKPVCYFIYPSTVSGNSTVLFKYREGMWKSCKEKIEKMIKNEFAELNYTMFDTEEEYKKFMKSENALIKLLSFVSAICVLICVFGFVSLVSLTCEERRKEIAIRKINGATAGNILAMFAKEYFLLLLIGAVVAFTAGYFIMQRWLEQYVKQTTIPVWIYLSIILVLALVIILCVGWQVYRASIENPADVVKSE